MRSQLKKKLTVEQGVRRASCGRTEQGGDGGPEAEADGGNMGGVCVSVYVRVCMCVKYMYTCTSKPVNRDPIRPSPRIHRKSAICSHHSQQTQSPRSLVPRLPM